MTTDFTKNAGGSVLVEVGETKVLCTAMVEESVPRFLLNSGRGWVTSEYDMLPSATRSRYQREARRGGIKGRTSEIQRLIGRSLRACVDMEKLGERTVYIDCDVLQADGGTRTASITGGFVALYLACRNLVLQGRIEENPIQFFVAAVSVGVVQGKTVVDLDYQKDSNADVDMNIVMDESGRLIEIQGTAEKVPFTRNRLSEMLKRAGKAIDGIVSYQKKVLKVT